MRLPRFKLFKPGSIEEACILLGEHGGKAKIIAGGTALIVDLGQGLLAPNYVISLKDIKGLDYVDYEVQQGLRLGALVTIEHLKTSPVIKEKYPILHQAAGQIGVPSIRYMGTVAGNLSLDTRCIFYNQSSQWRRVRPACFKRGGELCHAVKGGEYCHAVYQGDLGPPLMALGAWVRINRKKGERIIPLSDFFTGSGQNPNVLQPDEVITEIRIPPPAKNSTGSYQKLRIREAIDFPLAAVAVVLDIDKDRVCQKAKFVLGAIAAAPIEVTAADTIFNGRKINDSIDEAAEEAFKAAHPVDNLSIDARYRRKMLRVLTKRAVRQALPR